MFVGVALRIGEFSIDTSSGVFRVHCINRLADEECRYDHALRETKGIHIKPGPGYMSSRFPAHTLESCEVEADDEEDGPMHKQALTQMSRMRCNEKGSLLDPMGGFYVTRENVDKYGHHGEKKRNGCIS